MCESTSWSCPTPFSQVLMPKTQSADGGRWGRRESSRESKCWRIGGDSLSSTADKVRALLLSHLTLLFITFTFPYEQILNMLLGFASSLTLSFYFLFWVWFVLILKSFICKIMSMCWIMWLFCGISKGANISQLFDVYEEIIIAAPPNPISTVSTLDAGTRFNGL